MIENLLKGILSEALTDGKTKKPIGTISDELRREYIKWSEDKEELEAEVEFKIERLKRKLEKEIAEEFEEIFDEHMDKKKVLWQKIKGELGLFYGDSDLNINTKTGVISQWVKKDDNGNRL